MRSEPGARTPDLPERLWLMRLLTFAAVASVVGIVLLSWSPRSVVVRTGAAGPLEHVVAYWGAGLLACLSAPRRARRWIGLGFVCLAAILEIGQIWVPGRTSQFLDFAGNAAGAVLGIAFASAQPIATTLRGNAWTDVGSRATKALLIGLVFFGVAITPVWIALLLWFGFRMLGRMVG